MKGTLWCLHGAVGAAADWRGFAVPGWATQRIDLWRFLDCCPMSLPAFGQALNEEARAGEGKRVLVGYSMGARLALHALLADGPWDAAVLVAPHPGLEDPADRSVRRTADATWAAQALSGSWSDFLSAWNAQPVLAASPDFPDRSALKIRRQAVARSFMDWSLGVQDPLWSRLSEIKCPVLWVTGSRDAKFQALADRAIPLLPKAEAWIAPDSGHRVPWEARAAFATRVGEFLERADS
jgi:2-succinyl-6-hydroxy-2,4-cyclohexadiene-1-carboxylate synthase